MSAVSADDEASRSIDLEGGLSSAEVAERVAAGQVNDAPDARSRSLSDIVRANTFTWFNGLIGSMWIVMLLVAPIQDSLFGFIIIANTAIGIVQEYRASRALARLAVIGEAKPVVIRDGEQQEVPSAQIVLDDLILLRTGDQLVVDGVVLASDGLEIDESLLTGEADPVDKAVGDAAMSGSFVVAGSGRMRATRIGRESFAAGLTEQAKQFQVTNSELRDSIARFIRAVSYLLLPVGAILLFSQLVRARLPFDEAVRGTIAGMVTMVPEGLVLLTSIAMAVAVVRLARVRVLVQDMPAVEVLARVDTVCVDKTGTLTEPGMHLREQVELGDARATDVTLVLASLVATEPNPNPTLTAIRESIPVGVTPWPAQGGVPFSSARKWSAAVFGDQGTWVLGAPELLTSQADVISRAEASAADGARVLMLGRVPSLPPVDGPMPPVTPVALLVIDQRLRSDAAQTVDYFLAQGVTMKVISGDNAATVGAIAQQAGVPGAERPMDARELPEEVEAFADAVTGTSAFGRVTPLQKQAMVDALHLRGSTVAMTGDGVNDVLALKRADLGIAMGSGSGATRAVAQLVLLDDQWSVMPSVVAEGRRVLGNIERVSDVFLTKSIYAILISVATGLFAVAFPFLPRHLSLVSALTIGIPGFFLALMPSTDRFRPGFFRRVMLFAVPAGIIAALSAFASYGLALAVGEPLFNAQSAATVTLFIVSAAVLTQSARPLNPLRLLIVATMVVAFVGVLVIPWLSRFFGLTFSADRSSAVAIGIGAIGAVLVWVATLVTDRWRRA